MLKCRLGKFFNSNRLKQPKILNVYRDEQYKFPTKISI